MISNVHKLIYLYHFENRIHCFAGKKIKARLQISNFFWTFSISWGYTMLEWKVDFPLFIVIVVPKESSWQFPEMSFLKQEIRRGKTLKHLDFQRWLFLIKVVVKTKDQPPEGVFSHEVLCTQIWEFEIRSGISISNKERRSVKLNEQT